MTLKSQTSCGKCRRKSSEVVIVDATEKPLCPRCLQAYNQKKILVYEASEQRSNGTIKIARSFQSFKGSTPKKVNGYFRRGSKTFPRLDSVDEESVAQRTRSKSVGATPQEPLPNEHSEPPQQPADSNCQSSAPQITAPSKSIPENMSLVTTCQARCPVPDSDEAATRDLVQFELLCDRARLSLIAQGYPQPAVVTSADVGALDSAFSMTATQLSGNNQLKNAAHPQSIGMDERLSYVLSENERLRNQLARNSTEILRLKRILDSKNWELKKYAQDTKKKDATIKRFLVQHEKLVDRARKSFGT